MARKCASLLSHCLCLLSHSPSTSVLQWCLDQLLVCFQWIYRVFFSGWRQIEKKMGICLSLPSPPTQNLNIITYFFLWPWMAHFITLPVSTETNQYLFLLGESPGPCNMWGKVGWHRVRPRWVVKYNCGVAPTRWQSWRLSCKLDNLLVLVSVLV